MKLRIYLDTSVFSAYYDDRTPERQSQTQEFWAVIDRFEAATSELARLEIEQTLDLARRTRLLEMLDNVDVFPVTTEMRNLAYSYISAGVFTSTMFNDALHVAAAVLSRQDVLLSWNFKHLVNRRKRARVNDVNISMGLPTIDIVAPPEI